LKILSRFTGKVLFESGHETFKLTVVAAVESGANLSRANLRGANLSRATGIPSQICPKGGFFTACKKASGCVVELKIPAWAMRTSSIVGRKCRAEFAIVVDIRDKTNKQVDSVRGDYSAETIYEIGKIMKPDSYDPDPRVACSHGIHFFMTREEAEDYNSLRRKQEGLN
jgi:hypothetical protein